MEDYELFAIQYRSVGVALRRTAGLVGVMLGGWGITHPEAAGDLLALSYWLIPATGCLLYDEVKESWEFVDEILTGLKEELKNKPPYKRKNE